MYHCLNVLDALRSTDAVKDCPCRRLIDGRAAPGHVLVRSHEEQRGTVELIECLTAQVEQGQRHSTGCSGLYEGGHIGVVAESKLGFIHITPQRQVCLLDASIRRVEFPQHRVWPVTGKKE